MDDMEIPTFTRRQMDDDFASHPTPILESPLPPAPPPSVSEEAMSGNTLCGQLARAQSANGSYDDSVERTCAAVILLLLHGNTRSKGNRRRTMQKAVEWLQLQPPTDRIRLALEALESTEKTGVIPSRRWDVFMNEMPEGRMLSDFVKQHAKP